MFSIMTIASSTMKPASTILMALTISCRQHRADGAQAGSAVLESTKRYDGAVGRAQHGYPCSVDSPP